MVQTGPHDLAMVAFDSAPRARARNAIVQLDTDMRQSYDALRARLIPHLDPVIVVNNDSRGGQYWLVHEGRTETLWPVSQIFELAKAHSHIPLGIYSIVAPYLRDADTTDWVAPLEDYRETIDTALSRLDDADLPPGLHTSCSNLGRGGLRFIDRCLELGSFTTQSFKRFTASAHDDIRTNMWFASRAQVEGVEQTVKRWRRTVGERRWKDLYVVVLSIWSTSVLNQSSIIIRTLMDPEHVDTHLIDLPTAEPPADPLLTALDNLARIVQDDVAAGLIFPTDQDDAAALRDTQDLLSETILGILDCPYQGTRHASGADTYAKVRTHLTHAPTGRRTGRGGR